MGYWPAPFRILAGWVSLSGGVGRSLVSGDIRCGRGGVGRKMLLGRGGEWFPPCRRIEQWGSYGWADGARSGGPPR